MAGFPLPNGASEAERLLCPREVATRTGLSYHAVLRAIHRGELPAFRLCGRIRIRPGELDRWIEGHRIRSEGASFSGSPLLVAAPQPQRGSLAALQALESSEDRHERRGRP